MKVLTRLFKVSRQFHRRRFSNVKSPQDYCIDLVKKHDHENYVCSLFLRRSNQAAAFAIRAFNVEVANIEGQVSQAPIGQMRLKFWEESIEKIFGNNPPHHPVAQEIHRVLEKNALTKRNLLRLVLARSDKLFAAAFPTLDQMEKYAESSCTPIFHLLAASCGIENVNVDHAFSHLGKAQGLTNLIRAVPYYAQRRIVKIPQDILVKHNITQESIIRGRSDKPVRDGIFDIACLAHTHLDKAESMICKTPNSLFRHFLPIIPLRSYLERLRLVDFDVFHPTLQRRDNTLALKLLWATWRGKL